MKKPYRAFKPNNKHGAATKLVAAQMPRLRHAHPDQPFDWKTSDVMKWLVEQPEVLQVMLDSYRNSGAIIFDPDSGTWRGAETE